MIGPDGRWFTIADPPSPDTTHWVIRRKTEVVAAVRGGLLSLEEACSRYALISRNSDLGSVALTISDSRGFEQLGLGPPHAGSSTPAERKKTSTRG